VERAMKDVEIELKDVERALKDVERAMRDVERAMKDVKIELKDVEIALKDAMRMFMKIIKIMPLVQKIKIKLIIKKIVKFGTISISIRLIM
jgi:hypothetical protein